jgi:5-formyltetrahydrofolate cyclo-ligase
MNQAQALRQNIGALRDALNPAERLSKSEQIWKRLAVLPEFRQASQAFFYVSFKSEVDTTLMRNMSRELGLGVAVPRSQIQNKRLVFYNLDREADLESGPFGILQPPANSEKIADLEVPSLILVPGLVFDKHCNRLGWGAGFYDRFLSGEGEGLPAIGLAFDCQIVDRVPQNTHDISLSSVITESRTLRP